MLPGISQSWNRFLQPKKIIQTILRWTFINQDLFRRFYTHPSLDSTVPEPESQHLFPSEEEPVTRTLARLENI